MRGAGSGVYAASGDVVEMADGDGDEDAVFGVETP